VQRQDVSRQGIQFEYELGSILLALWAQRVHNEEYGGWSMVGRTGASNPKGNKRPSLPLYFYINEQVHRRLRINRGQDIVVTWNYPEGKKITYNYTDTLRRFKPCFGTQAVAKMVMRKRLVIDIALRDGMIERPQRTYSLDESRKPLFYMWSEKDILDLLAYLSTVHRGRPRKDGQITPAYLPTPREVKAMINGEGETLWVKQGDNFVPTWRAKEF
jgi:hypothetical protein